MIEPINRPMITMPDAVEPSLMKFTDLHAETLDPGKKIRVFIQTTPFIETPILEIILKNSLGAEVCQTRIIEPAINRMSIFLHIRQNKDTAGVYTLIGNIIYPEIGLVSSLEAQYGEADL